MFELLIYRPDSNRDIDLLNWSFDLCQLYNNIQIKVNDKWHSLFTSQILNRISQSCSYCLPANC